MIQRGTSTHESQPPTRAQTFARERFELQIRRLRDETNRGRPRENLGALVRVCEGLLDEAGSGPIVRVYRDELGRARAAVAFSASR